jgi:hypothetical protein
LWTFETASTEGWGIDTDNPTFSGDWNAVSNVVQTQTQEHSGSYSMNIGGFTLSFWAYWTPYLDDIQFVPRRYTVRTSTIYSSPGPERRHSEMER